MKCACEPKVEVGPIDENHSVWLSLKSSTSQCLIGLPKLRQDAADFNDAHDLKIMGANNRLDTRGA
jgi:hypothetical protein